MAAEVLNVYHLFCYMPVLFFNQQ